MTEFNSTEIRNDSPSLNILKAAYSLFIRQGYHGTSMRQIAQEAPIALGGIYHHFKNKEAIFSAVFAANHPYHRILPILADIPFDSLEQFLRIAATEMFREVERRPEFLNLVFIEIVEFRGSHLTDIYAQAVPQIAALMNKFAGVQDRLRTASLSIIVRSFLGLLLSYGITEHYMTGRLPISPDDNVIESMLDIYLYGILKGDSNAST